MNNMRERYGRGRPARRGRLAVVVAGAILTLAASGLASAQASSGTAGTEVGRAFAVVAGRSRVLQVNDVMRVAVADPNVADVVVASKNEVIVNGKLEGRTTLYVWDASGRAMFDVQVYVDNEGLLREIEGAIRLGGLRARFARTTLVLDGEVETEAEAKRAELIAGAYADKVINLVTVTERTKPLPPPSINASEVQVAIGIEGVQVRVLNDTVILEGAVTDPADSDRAEKIARVFSDKVLNFIPTMVEVISGSQKAYATLTGAREATAP